MAESNTLSANESARGPLTWSIRQSNPREKNPQRVRTAEEDAPRVKIQVAVGESEVDSSRGRSI